MRLLPIHVLAGGMGLISGYVAWPRPHFFGAREAESQK